MTDTHGQPAPETDARLNVITAAMVEAMDADMTARFTVSIVRMIKLAEDEARANGREDPEHLTWMRQLLAELIGA